MNPYFLLVPVILWLVVLTFLFLKTRKFYEKVFSGKRAQNFEEVIGNILTELQEEKIERRELAKRLEALADEAKKHVKYTNFYRFNPFKELTEGQSFVFVLLDQEQNGIILNFIYSHNQYRIYPKIIQKGKGKQVELTEEEQKAINSALKTKI